MSMREHDNEPVNGLPELLPRGERILWQGKPEWRPLTQRALMLGPVAVYFIILAVWRSIDGMATGVAMPSLIASVLWLMPVAVLALGILTALGYFFARTTVYTITNRRIVMRFGVALPMAVNLPFTEIGSADVARHADGTADICFTMTGKGKIAYLHLWPNVRPWKLSKPQPALRALAAPDTVIAIVADALSQTSGARSVVSRPAPEPASTPIPGAMPIPNAMSR